MVTPKSLTPATATSAGPGKPSALRQGKHRQGSVDALKHGRVTGWAKRQNSDQPLYIDIYINDFCVATRHLADRYREDLEKAGLGDGRYGFIVPLTEIPDIQEDEVTISIWESGTPDILVSKVVKNVLKTVYFLADPLAGLSDATGQPILFQPQQRSGAIDALKRGRVSGWAKHPDREQSLYIDIYINTVCVVLNYLADEYREDLEKAEFGHGCYGFVAPLEVVPDIQGDEIIVSIRESGKPDILASKVFENIFKTDNSVSAPTKQSSDSTDISFLPATDTTTAQMDFHSPEIRWRDEIKAKPASHVIHIASCEINDFTLTVNGWACDVSRLGFPVRLALLVNGEEKKKCLARISDDTLGGRVFPCGAYGFEVSCLVSEAEIWPQPCVEMAALGEDGKHLYKVKACLTQDILHTQQNLSIQLVPADAEIDGVVDSISREGMNGWALSHQYPDAMVDLQLFMDGRPFSYTRCTRFRPDVQKEYGGQGYSGFYFELPPSLAIATSVVYRMEACRGDTTIKKGVGKIMLLPTVIMPSTIAVDRSFSAMASVFHEQKTVSVIIVNQNGAEILDEMLKSAEKINDYQNIEWIVVDHQSTDGSAQVCHDARERGFDIHFCHRNGNFSFSDSNNYGVQHSTGEIVIFANNDLLFIQPFSKKICHYLSDPNIGALGVKLLDHVPDIAEVEALPIQHLGVFFNPYQLKNGIRPYEARRVEEMENTTCAPVIVPCVTAAFMAVRRQDIDAVGGFDTGYIYGLEDVDLCLKIRQRLEKTVVCANDITLIHRRGFTRKHNTHAEIYKNNNAQLNQAWAHYLRKIVRQDTFRTPGFWTGSRPVIAFIVTNASMAAPAADYFTALEFGRALQKILPVHVRFMEEKHWYDLYGVDVLVVMTKKFDLLKVQNVSPFLLTINWMRQWFDAWAEDPTLYAYNYLFASSQKAADYITEKTGRSVDVLRIASDVETFSSGKAVPTLACDYCFTGSFFKLAREIQFQLDPEMIRGKGAVYGHNWEGTVFAPISKGPVPYDGLPDVYASAKIVIDDANIATKPWGSCNSRVFDALAAGCLLVTNGADGVHEIFGDLVPTFHDKDSLQQVLNYWLSHEEERRERVRQLREIVFSEHTYDNRARQFVEVMKNRYHPIRVAIKCPAVFTERARWGDYHFAEALAVELRRKGHVVRVDCREAWESGIANSDDVVFVLRGVLAYTPKMHQKNIMWLISHPHDVGISELLGYDHVYCASAYHADLLSTLSGMSVTWFPQCVDSNRFSFIPERIHTRPDRVLFVGNSRGVFRDTVRWAVEKELEIDVYGNGWEPFLKDHRLKGKLIPNEILAEAYASSKYVLCDHWEDMKRLGYVSNRVLDVLAVGGKILVDDVKGIDELVPSGYKIFTTAEEYGKLISLPVEVNMDERKKLADWIAEKHSFFARADVVDKQIQKLLNGPVQKNSFSPPLRDGKNQTAFGHRE